MRVKMLVGLSGPAILLDPGDEHDFPQREAERLIAAGFAVPVREERVETAAAMPAPERAAKRRKR